jgi:catechol 2,3-dioxygenase-like lactoylglutathione lyase family enzyme
MSSIRGLGEIVLWVHDMEKSLRFYRDTLGLRQMSTPDMRGAIFLQVGPEVVHCPQQVVLVPLPTGSEAFPSERNKRTMHHFGLEIAPDSFDAEQARLKAAGLDVRYGEHPFLQLRGMYIDDPDGNEVELIAKRP